MEQEATGRLTTARLVPPGEGEAGVVLNVLFASSGIEPEIAEAAEVLEILPGLRVPIASVGHLLALKLLSQDAPYTAAGSDRPGRASPRGDTRRS